MMLTGKLVYNLYLLNPQGSLDVTWLCVGTKVSCILDLPSQQILPLNFAFQL